MKNDRLLRALKREPVDCTPIWIMRQAGRYLPEYRAIRKTVKDFMALCKNPTLACEVTLQPLRRFNIDAAILFSDILTIPDAMGLGLSFTEGEGPRFANTIRSESDFAALKKPSSADLDYVMQTIRLLKPELSVPLIGFAGSPFTIASYMIEGGGSKTFSAVKRLLYSEPLIFLQLLQLLTECITDYLTAQIDAGVDVVMLFDTWGGLLTTAQYQQFSLSFMQQIVQRLQKRVPTILFTKGGNLWLESIAKTGCDAIGVDWTIDLKVARERVGDRVALQGNLDPGALYGSSAALHQEVTRILQSYGSGPGHIFNLGHGIHPDVDPSQVKYLVDTVHALSCIR